MERPQRHRRGVNHYSDDNPSTFTVKRRRGQQRGHSPPSTPSNVTATAAAAPILRGNSAERRAARAEGRRQKQPSSSSKSSNNTSTERPRSTNTNVPKNTKSSTENNNNRDAITTKRGPGRPPNPNSKRRKRRLQQLAQHPEENDSVGAKCDGPGVTKEQHPSPEKAGNCGADKSWSRTALDVMVSHAVSIQPILPLTWPERPTLAQRYPHIYQDDKKYHIVRTQAPPSASAFASSSASSGSSSLSSSTGTLNNWTRIVEAHKERWVPLQQNASSISVNQNQHNAAGVSSINTTEEQSLLALPPAPWTCFAVRKDDPLYFCVGDAAGNLLLYRSHPRAMCIQTVVTTAAKREAERPILWSQTTQKGILTYPNSAGAVSWHRNVCVIWTRQEIEILDVVEHTTLAYLALDAAGAIQNHCNLSSHSHNSSIPNSVNNNSKRQSSYPFQSLDLHLTESLLLWRPLRSRTALDAVTKNPTGGEGGNDDGSIGGDGSVSLYCIDFSHGPMRVQRRVVAPRSNGSLSNEDCSSTIYNKPACDFLCHGAVWDHRSRDEILAVISQPREKEPSSVRACLCRMNVDGEISQRSILPESGSVSGRISTIYTDCVLEQHGDFLFLCTGRGIRCYEIDRLTFLTVYGETVALHNKTVGWQGCYWIPEPSFDPSEVVISSGGGVAGVSSLSLVSSSKNRQSHCWIHRADHLAAQEQYKQHRYQQQQKCLWRQESNDSTSSVNTNSACATTTAPVPGGTTSSQKGNKLFSNMLLVGVPHPTRGPSELQSTLYVWKPGEVLPLTTLQAPPGGLLGVYIHSTETTGWKLTCATAKLGQGWQLSASLKSDFAGTMYPVGYQILNDNVEYLEDEEELDTVIDIPEQEQHLFPEDSPQRNREESDLQKALKQSLVTATEDKISVLLDEVDDDKHDRVLVPSIPDPSLREVFDEDDPTSPKSPNRRVRSTPQALTLFPQYTLCKETAMEQAQEHAKRMLLAPPPSTSQALSIHQPLPQQQQTMKMKGKRSRTATVDAMLQASVDPLLKYRMGMFHKKWGNRGGTRFVHGSNSSSDLEGGKPFSGTTDACVTTTKKNAEMEAIPFEPVMNRETRNAIAAPWIVSCDLKTTMTASLVPPAQNGGALTEDNTIVVDDGVESSTQLKECFFCAACHGRMVVHICGKRELPVDTEALERAEKARKELEQAEQKRLRAERRRLAEAKRRENRRKQKEIEDRRLYAERMEEERRLRAKIEEEQELERKERHAAVLRLVGRDPALTQRSLQLQSHQPVEVVPEQHQPRLALSSSSSLEYGRFPLPTSMSGITSTTPSRLTIPKFSELRTSNCYNSCNGSFNSDADHDYNNNSYSGNGTINSHVDHDYNNSYGSNGNINSLVDHDYNNNNRNHHGPGSAAHGFYSTPATDVLETWAPSTTPVTSSDDNPTEVSIVPDPMATITTNTTGISPVPPEWTVATDVDDGDPYGKPTSEPDSETHTMVMRRDLSVSLTPSDGDALAALVGLAESLAPIRTPTIAATTTPSSSFGHYDYSGSSDRRSAILAQYSSQFKELEASSSSLMREAPTMKCDHSAKTTAAAAVVSTPFASASLVSTTATYHDGTGVVVATRVASSNDGENNEMHTTIPEYGGNHGTTRVGADSILE